MDKIIKTDKMGIDYDCYIVAQTNYDGIDYLICTDFINDDNDNIRLFAVKVVDNRFLSIPYEESRRIVNDFEVEKEKYLKEVRS